MADTPMVIMWPNTDGTVTLSQRQAPADVMPTVVPNPPRTATVVDSLTSLTGNQPKFGYSIPVSAGPTSRSKSYDTHQKYIDEF